MRRALLMTCFMAAVGLLLLTHGQGKEPDTTSVFMQKKLKHAQKILEAIALEDYKEIDANSQALILLSHESNWNVFQTVEYNQQSAEFRRTVGRIRDAAKKKNIDGAALAYVQMTMNCVECHKYVRGEQKED